MGDERSFMQLCRVVGDLIVVPFGSEVMVKWLGWRQNRVEAVLWILQASKKFVILFNQLLNSVYFKTIAILITAF